MQMEAQIICVLKQDLHDLLWVARDIWLFAVGNMKLDCIKS